MLGACAPLPRQRAPSRCHGGTTGRTRRSSSSSCAPDHHASCNDAVPPADRIADVRNDGTLWARAPDVLRSCLFVDAPGRRAGAAASRVARQGAVLVGAHRGRRETRVAGGEPAARDGRGDSIGRRSTDCSRGLSSEWLAASHASRAEAAPTLDMSLLADAGAAAPIFGPRLQDRTSSPAARHRVQAPTSPSARLRPFIADQRRSAARIKYEAATWWRHRRR